MLKFLLNYPKPTRKYVILEHEIPQGSKLYFAKSAKIKRQIESEACKILYKNGYEEILTPIFSYHKHSNRRDENEILRLSNEQNFLIALRNDSTIDVIKIVLKRVGKNLDHKRWFYIQPIYKYPTNEIHQIGVENIDDQDIFQSLKVLVEIFESFEITPILQVSNMQIPLLIQKECGLDIELFLSGNVEKILENKHGWLHKLLRSQNQEQLESTIADTPDFLKEELEKLLVATKNLNYKNIAIAPLYYSPMEYYDGLYFRMFDKNSTLAVGGGYRFEEIESNGFAIYTDRVVEHILER